jgi:hypothetical protein
MDHTQKIVYLSMEGDVEMHDGDSKRSVGAALIQTTHNRRVTLLQRERLKRLQGGW